MRVKVKARATARASESDDELQQLNRNGTLVVDRDAKSEGTTRHNQTVEVKVKVKETSLLSSFPSCLATRVGRIQYHPPASFNSGSETNPDETRRVDPHRLEKRVFSLAVFVSRLFT